jgi:hypothetical protein
VNILNLTQDNMIQLVNTALDTLLETTGIRAWVAPLLPFANNENQPNVIIQIVAGEYRWDFSGKIKAYISNDSIASIIAELREKDSQSLLITRHISYEQGEKLRKAGIAFIDAAGNAFIHKPNLYVYIIGRRTAKELVQERLPRIFQASGLKVLFSLLADSHLVQSTYRQITEASDTSVGTVNIVMEELRRKKYLLESPTGRILFNNKEVVKQWVEHYPARLRPKLLVSRYTSRDKDWWKKVDLEEVDACWGGEVAAALVTNHLKPETQTLYSNSNLAELQIKFGWKRDPNGEIEVLKKFWTSAQNPIDQNIVPMLLIYADLLVSADERNIETAEMIYDKYLT